jgi:2-polyprenyl-3-methyl-5-hydroxy-6-metoxy-1,4-benzoquinol methylase
MDLSFRADLPELMDAEDLDIAEYNRCLADLAKVNKLTMTHRSTLQFLQSATARLSPGVKISVLDIAFGHGDLLRAIARWAAKRGFHATLSGIDLNPRSAAAARAATSASEHIEFLTGDVFSYTPRQKPDFIVTSQFTHHLTDADIVKLLRWMDERALSGWHIADLHRHALPYYGFRLLCRLMGWHHIVRYDGTVSIARSFKKSDWQTYLRQASIAADVTWHPLFRYAVARLK